MEQPAVADRGRQLDMIESCIRHYNAQFERKADGGEGGSPHGKAMLQSPPSGEPRLKRQKGSNAAGTAQESGGGSSGGIERQEKEERLRWVHLQIASRRAPEEVCFRVLILSDLYCYQTYLQFAFFFCFFFVPGFSLQKVHWSV